MNQYLKSSLLAILSLVIVTQISSCRSVDPEFGNEIVPPEWQMFTDLDTLTGLQTYTYKVDSVPTIRVSKSIFDSHTNFPVGSMIDSYVGRIDAQIFTNFNPRYDFVKTGRFFGPNPKFDSIKLNLYFVEDKFVGDTTVAREFEVYEVIDGSYRWDKEYFSDFDITPNIAATPMGSFKMTKTKLISVKLPKAYGEQFVTAAKDPDNPYLEDSLFIDKFKGVYIKSKNQTTTRGSVYYVDLSISNVELYYRDDKGNDDIDTTSTRFNMYGLSYYGSSTPYNTNLSLAQHDNSFAALPSAGGVDLTEIGDSTIHTKLSHISAMGGLGTKVVIPEDQIEKLRSKAEKLGYKRIIVHLAKLEFEFAEKLGTNFDNSYLNMAPYFNLLRYSFTRDYNPLVYQSSEEQVGRGALMNRSNGRYTIDITSYMQQRFNGEKVSEKLEIAPALSQLIECNRSVLMGSASTNPPKLIITYTMMLN